MDDKFVGDILQLLLGALKNDDFLKVFLFLISKLGCRKYFKGYNNQSVKRLRVKFLVK